MKCSLKRIICLALTLSLLLGAILFISSCKYTYEVLTETNGGAQEEIDEKNDTPTNDSTSAGGTENGNNSSGESLNFYPGANDPSAIDALSPAARALLSVVAIDAKLDIKSSYPYYGSSSTTEYTSYGSGVILSLDREAGNAYVITNYHVVYNKDEVAPGGFSDTISLYLYGMQDKQYAIDAKVVGGSMTYDVAILKIEDSEILKNSMATAATLGDSETVRIYDKVMAIGNPEGYGISLTEGIVSVESESLAMTGADGRTSLSLRVMRISAAINDGNSGGGLFDENGRLIGVVNAKRTGSEVDNIAYAIPVNLAKALADRIIKTCNGTSELSLTKCVVGFDIDSKSSGLISDGKGNLIIVEEVYVSSVTDTSFAKGELLVGDIINSVTIDGVKIEVTRIHHLVDSMFKANAQSTLVFNVTRNGESFDIPLTVPESAFTKIK